MRANDFIVLQASSNTGSLLGVAAEALVGQSIAALVGSAQASRLLRAVERAVALDEDRLDAPVPVTIAIAKRPVRFDALVSRTGDVLLLELEPTPNRDMLSVYSFQSVVRQTLSRIRGSQTVRSLAQAIAEQVRVLTGYDRVWVYRFHPDWHGEIIAESGRQGIQSWLGLHYPASDIPAQARALFVEHPLRVIADVNYTPSPLVPALRQDTGAPTDLSASILRSVSPVHLQYMRNMGVRSSLVVSLVKDGVLWGLISGHDYGGTKTVAHEVRTVCEFLSEAFSIQLALAQAVEERDQTLRVRSVTSTLLARLLREADPVHALLGGGTTMLDLAEASGGAVVLGNTIAATGAVPSDEEIRALVAWIDTVPSMADGHQPAGERTASVYATTELCNTFPEAAAYADVASGVIACRIAAAEVYDHGPSYLLWFRGERRQTVPWAGDPTKPLTVSAQGVARLEPRGSFALWEQEVRGSTAPWPESALEATASLGGVASRILVSPAADTRRARRREERETLSRELSQIARQATSAASDPSGTSLQSMAELAERLESLMRDLSADVEAESALGTP